MTPFPHNPDHPPRAAILMSGEGSNAEKLLSAPRNWTPAVIVTDRPATSRAAELAERFNIPLAALDIAAFYRAHGESRVSLATENGRRIREQWTARLREALQPYQPDFGILAGFVPLSNITADFPCLNVHPGDLTVERDGHRLLVGLHRLPVELAIIEGLDHMRSSVIIANPYSGHGGDMDSGPIPGISPKVPIQLHGVSIEELRAIHAARPTQRPPAGYKDKLEEIAGLNLEELKRHGDWIVLPAVVEAFAAGCYTIDNHGGLCFRHSADTPWMPVLTVEYQPPEIKPIPRRASIHVQKEENTR